MQQNKFVEPLQNTLGRGRRGGGMTRFRKMSLERKCKNEESRNSYQAAKGASNPDVHLAKNEAEKNVFKTINARFVEIYRWLSECDVTTRTSLKHVISVPGVSFANFYLFSLIDIYLFDEKSYLFNLSDALCCMLLKHGL